MSEEKPMEFEGRKTVTGLMLDQIASREGAMVAVEGKLLTQVLLAAQREGVSVDVPVVTWTCSVVAREKNAFGGYSG